MTLEKYIVNSLPLLPPEGLTGRTKIISPVKTITPDNVKDVLEKALAIHAVNASQIEYLWRYYKGSQDIKDKTKMVRENINNKVTVNRANEIVTFKTAYLLNEPIQYISNGGDDDISAKVAQLNDYMRAEDKESKDKEIVDWLHICGVAERLVLDDRDMGVEDGAPYCIYTLDPKQAFVIYNAGIGQKPLAGVILQIDENEKWFANVYTRNMYFRVNADGTMTYQFSGYNGIPLIEYENNTARMGAFEPVISLLNSINTLESNAVDSVEDFVNAFDVFQNCAIEDGEYSQLSVGGKAVMVKTVTQGMEAKVYRVASEISQSGVQTRIDDMNDAIFEIVGMPNRNGGSSTSDTGSAVIFRDGWSEAESRAKDSEKLFTRSEREMLRMVLHICRVKDGGKYDLGLSLGDIKTEFLRKNLANLQSKTQTLCEMLNNDYIHPKMAYEAAGVFKDNEQAYRLGLEWNEEQAKKTAEDLDRISGVKPDEQETPTGGDT